MSEHHPPGGPSTAGVADGPPDPEPAGAEAEGDASSAQVDTAGPQSVPAHPAPASGPSPAAAPPAAADETPRASDGRLGAADDAPPAADDAPPAAAADDAPPAAAADDAPPAAADAPPAAAEDAPPAAAADAPPAAAEDAPPAAADDAPPAAPPLAPSEAPPAEVPLTVGEGPSAGDAPAERRGRPALVLVVLLVAVLAAGAVLFVSRTRDAGDDVATAPNGSNTQNASTGAGAPGATARPPSGIDYETFRDEEMGFSLKYPKAWQVVPVPPSNPDVAEPDQAPLRFVVSNGRMDGAWVRFARVEHPVTQENLTDMKAVTDAVVTGGDVVVLQHRPVTLNGMPGYHYLYTFKDKDTGIEGAHSHYFLFQGRKMHSLVFQALPVERFKELAITFDEMAESFHSTPDTEPAPEAPPASPGS